MSELSKHVNLIIELREYSIDGDEEILTRHLDMRTSGGNAYDLARPFTELNAKGGELTPDEVEGLNMVIAGFRKMLGEYVKKEV